MKPTRIFDFLVILACAGLLSACAGTADVEFAPNIQEDPDATGEGVESRPYSDEVAGISEELYGGAPAEVNQTYERATQQNPVLRYNVIYFDFNASDIKPEGLELLMHHAEFMQGNTEVMLLIEGHADKRGTSGYNLALGERRAKSVRDILQAHGISMSRISIVSYGEERPAVEGNTEEAFGRNRRAELIYR